MNMIMELLTELRALIARHAESEAARQDIEDAEYVRIRVAAQDGLKNALSPADDIKPVMYNRNTHR
jgi:hypothetical protein